MTTARPAGGTVSAAARGVAIGRRAGSAAVGAMWRPRVLGAWRVPAAGPVILAGNHAHNVDGPLLFSTCPRPVHFLVKQEAFTGPLDPLLRAVGQLPVDRTAVDRGAIDAALEVLARGGVLGIFPEGTRGAGDFTQLHDGLAYFALRTGAPVVPAVVLGSARRGRLISALPPLRARIDVVFGDPFDARDGSGLRTRSAVHAATVRIRKRLAAHLESARSATGRA